MTAAAGALAAAVRGGLVSAGDALAGRVRVAAVGASNQVHVVASDAGPLAYVKSPGQAARLDGDDTVARETAALAHVGGWAAPTVLPLTTPRSLWLAPVSGPSLVEVCLTGDVGRLSDTFAAVGTTLAGLHALPVTAGSPPMLLPWPMLGALPAHMDSARHHAWPSRIIRAARDAADVMDMARLQWTATGWVHGDVSPANLVLTADGARLIDWESAGIGDQSWDLAGARVMVDALATGWAGVAWGRLASAYRDAGGPAAEPTPTLRCVRLLVAAYQYAVGAVVAGADPDKDGTVSAMMDGASAAAALARRGDDVQR